MIVSPKNSDNTITYAAADVAQIVETHVLPRCVPGAIITLSGLLGAGKTTLAQEILRQKGVREAVVSPTFAYVNTYVLAGGGTCHHFDLYRLHAEDDFFQLGFEEYLQDGAMVLIEWPTVIADVLTHRYRDRLCQLVLSYDKNDHGVRKVSIYQK